MDMQLSTTRRGGVWYGNRGRHPSSPPDASIGMEPPARPKKPSVGTVNTQDKPPELP
jgi:hypothetical protein